MTIYFRDCTLVKLDKLFGLRQVRPIQPVLKEWLASQAHDWNESELAVRFIGPLMALVNYGAEKFDFFTQRSFSGKIGDIELSGKPDAVIALGERKPEKPYFCFQEYKRENDPEGDPAGQMLTAMLLAQEFNEHQQPDY